MIIRIFIRWVVVAALITGLTPGSTALAQFSPQEETPVRLAARAGVVLRALAAAQSDYYADHGRYGTFEEVRGRVASYQPIHLSPDQSQNQIIPGYSLIWLFNSPDRTYWLVIAWPRSPTSWPLAMDAGQKTLKLFPTEIHRPEVHKLAAEMNLSASRDKRGKYDWIGSSQLNNPKTPLYLLLPEEQDQYVILGAPDSASFWDDTPGQDGRAFLYISSKRELFIMQRLIIYTWITP